MNSRFKASILLIITMIFWGGSWPVTKVIVNMAPTFTVGFFRFLIASILFLIILPFFSNPLKYNKRTIRDFFLLGLSGIFGYGFFFLVGLTFTTAAQGSIIAGINPVSISIFSHLLYGEKLDRKWQYSGFVFSFIGVIFVIGIQSLIDFEIDHLIGNLLILTAMGCWGIYSSLGKKVMETYTSLEATTGAVFFGMLLFSLGAISEEFWNEPGLRTPDFWFLILFLGICVTVVGFFFYFEGIKSIGPTHASIFINLVPIFGTFFSAIFLKEEIYWTFLVGLVLIIIGIVIINFPIIKKSERLREEI